jgi:hypothetical protein
LSKPQQEAALLPESGGGGFRQSLAPEPLCRHLIRLMHNGKEAGMITRRLALGLMAAGVQRLFAAPGSEARPGMRPYRVDATILILSLPIFTRSGVGRGYARYAVTGSPDRSVHEMEFAAGSLPERAHGLNRLGMIRETSTETPGGLTEARYFGFMTASREESIGEARKALSSSIDHCLFLAIEGESQPGEVLSRRARFYADARNGWNERGRLQQAAEVAVHNQTDTSGEARFRPGPTDAVVPTFLFALSRAMRAHPGQSRQTFVYSGSLFDLTTFKKEDRRTGRRLAGKGLTARPESVMALSGTIRNRRTGNKTPFRLWAEEGGDLIPLRIEYQPRGFLQLALEAERG